MVIDGWYSIHQEVKQNRLVICLPQTQETLVSTAEPISYRRTELSEEEETIILGIVKRMYEPEGE